MSNFLGQVEAMNENMKFPPVRNKKEDIQKAIELTNNLVDELNNLHPEAFDYAIFALNKMR